MLISNLSYLLGAKELAKADMSEIKGFSTNIAKYADAFFAKNEDEAVLAARNGAFVIICSFIPKHLEAETYYFLVNDLRLAIFALIKYFVIEKNLHIIVASKPCELFIPAFGLQSLENDVFKDLKTFFKAKKNSFFFSCDLAYCKHFSQEINAKKLDLRLVKSGLITCDITINGYFYTLPLPFEFAPFFASLLAKIWYFKKDIVFKLDKINAINAYFVNDKNEIVAYGAGSRAFILANDLAFNILAKSKAFKVANKDFNYFELNQLKNFHNFKYALLNESCENFELVFKPEKTSQLSLF